MKAGQPYQVRMDSKQLHITGVCVEGTNRFGYFYGAELWIIQGRLEDVRVRATRRDDPDYIIPLVENGTYQPVPDLPHIFPSGLCMHGVADGKPCEECREITVMQESGQ